MSKFRCTGKEGFQRMNYLYQVSNILATQSVAGNSASSLNTNLLVNISRKTVQRMEIDMKRTICKRCRCLLLAGITSRMRIRKKKLVSRCLKCGHSRILNIENKSYLPWTQQDESVVEVMDFGKSSELQVNNDRKLPQKEESQDNVELSSKKGQFEQNDNDSKARFIKSELTIK